jgi:hypothetical protein
VWRADGDFLKNVLIGKINKKTSTWKTKNKMEKHSRKGYETDRSECNVRLDFGQRKMENITSGSAGP